MRIIELIAVDMQSKAWACDRSLVRILPSVRLPVFWDYCVLSGRGLCDGLISPTEGTYRLCCVQPCVMTATRELGGPVPLVTIDYH